MKIVSQGDLFIEGTGRPFILDARSCSRTRVWDTDTVVITTVAIIIIIIISLRMIHRYLLFTYEIRIERESARRLCRSLAPMKMHQLIDIEIDERARIIYWDDN